jgi:hypothetical protein
VLVYLGEAVLPRFRAVSRIALVCSGVLAMAVAVAGCKNSAQVFENNNEGGWFSKKVDIFAKPEWAVVGDSKAASLGPSGPVDANDLVGADGRCAAAAPEPAPAAAPAPPADRAVGSMAGDLAGAPMPAAMPVSAYPNDNTLGGVDANAPQVMGGIALGMTECQAVQRAGLPGNVAISAGEKGERKVVLTYLTGVWPGIYHFSDGRLKEIVRAPAPPEPPKPVKKLKAKKPVAKPKTATNQTLPRASAQ